MEKVVDQIFPDGHEVRQEGDLLLGEGRCGKQTVAVIGTTNHTEVGVELALAMAAAVLAVMRDHPERPIVFLVDTSGQRLRHRDEMLGLNGYMAHLAKCVEMARRRGHAIISLVYEQALSGGFLANGMMADVCAALPEAEIRVMGLAGDGARDAHQRGKADRAQQIFAGVCAGREKLSADGRPRRIVGRRPVSLPDEGAGACRCDGSSPCQRA